MKNAVFWDIKTAQLPDPAALSLGKETSVPFLKEAL
jgi:hypothetical protein